MSRPKSRLAIARVYKREIAKLQRQREKLYHQALKETSLPDTTMSFDYFFNDQVGWCSAEEDLR